MIIIPLPSLQIPQPITTPPRRPENLDAGLKRPRHFAEKPPDFPKMAAKGAPTASPGS
jgi:hypothetical protein